MFPPEILSFLNTLPTVSKIAVRVSPFTEKKIREGAPHLFTDHILKQSQPGHLGDQAILFDRKNRFLAFGLLAPQESIRIRILERKPTELGRSWFTREIKTAFEKRRFLFSKKTNGFRLLNGENEKFAGLVVDHYDRTLVLKLYTGAWLPYLQEVTQALVSAVSPERIVLRLSRFLQESERFPSFLSDGCLLWGKPLDGPIIFSENGLFFEVDPILGQKTGFFLDQRENRMRVESLSAGKNVLNVFAYTGGFSLYATRGQATSVLSVDLSRPALESALKNFELNPAVKVLSEHKIWVGDAFQVLTEMKEQKRFFEMVILDPPSFAKKKSEVPKAVSAYQYLLRLGLSILRSGGILVMASCSQPVETETFFSMIVDTTQKEGRRLVEIERTGHAVDHPVTFQGGRYLKCLFATVY